MTDNLKDIRKSVRNIVIVITILSTIFSVNLWIYEASTLQWIFRIVSSIIMLMCYCWLIMYGVRKQKLKLMRMAHKADSTFLTERLAEISELPENESIMEECRYSFRHLFKAKLEHAYSIYGLYMYRRSIYDAMDKTTGYYYEVIWTKRFSLIFLLIYPLIHFLNFSMPFIRIPLPYNQEEAERTSYRTIHKLKLTQFFWVNLFFSIIFVWRYYISGFAFILSFIFLCVGIVQLCTGGQTDFNVQFHCIFLAILLLLHYRILYMFLPKEIRKYSNSHFMCCGISNVSETPDK